MKRTTKKIFILATAAVWILNVGCATFSANREQLSRVKKVALAGFLVRQTMPKDFTVFLTAGNSHSPGWGPGIPKPDVYAQKMYDSLRATLTKEMKWQVIDSNAIRTNAQYIKLYDDKMKGLQSRPPMPEGVEPIGAEGIIDAWAIQRLDKEEKEKLMAQLGVDAIAVADVSIELEKGGGIEMLVGGGKLLPVAKTTFYVYGKNSEDPIWSDLSVRGEISKEGAKHWAGVAKPDDVKNLSVGVVPSSYQKLVERLRKG